MSQSGYYQLPSYRITWEEKEDVQNFLVTNYAMRKSRFVELMRFVHFASLPCMPKNPFEVALRSGTSVVLDLQDALPEDYKYKFYIDNYFSSIELAENLEKNRDME